MYVRLAFSVAANLEPEILMVDEVLAVGDVKFQQKCLGKMNEVSKGGRTVLLVSHNMATVRSLCPRIVLLDQGQVAFQGESDEGISQYLEGIAAKSEEISLGERRDRGGTGSVRLQDIYLENQRGYRVEHFLTGKGGRIIMKYENKEMQGSAIFMITICDDFGNPVSHLNNHLTANELLLTAPRGTITCEIGELPLKPGRYRLNLAVQRHGQMLDHIVGAFRLLVEEHDFYGTGKLTPPGQGGVLLLKHRWHSQHEE